MSGVPAGRPVILDVRDDIRRGEEPFARIMAAVKALRPGEVFVLRVPFEPVPLYRVLGKQGFQHHTEALGPEDWKITFSREGAAAPAPAPQTAAADGEGETVLDVRGLEPPQPMVTVLERLDTLGPRETLVVRHERRPLFLYPHLEARGFAYETSEQGPGLVEIRIRHAGA